MPNFARLASAGTFAPLGTTIPPQSPVAWSTFITGLDPGGHGIFDFIHRDPKTMQPYLSTTRTEAGGAHAHDRALAVSACRADASSCCASGQPFWEVLEERGVPTTIIRMPANFPPSGTATRELSGMGTPDILGHLRHVLVLHVGAVRLRRPDRCRAASSVAGRRRGRRGAVRRSRARTIRFAPSRRRCTSPFTAYIDADKRYVKLVVGERRAAARGRRVERLGARRVRADAVAVARRRCAVLSEAARSVLRAVRQPAQYRSARRRRCRSRRPRLRRRSSRSATGRFYTQGMPEDTKSLKTGVLTVDEFLAQARIAGEENRRQYTVRPRRLQRRPAVLLLRQRRSGVAHDVARARSRHPAYDAATRRAHEQVVEELYAGLDAVVGETLARLGPDDLLVVMSDHGFTSWRRAFHLNSWLRDHGYLAVRDPKQTEDPGFFGNVDWTRTRAYGLGLNGLYVNVQGPREGRHRRPRAARSARRGDRGRSCWRPSILRTAAAAITKVYRREQAYHLAGHEDIAPDLIVGYAKGTRGSDESALGGTAARRHRRQHGPVERRPLHGSRGGAGDPAHQPAAAKAGAVARDARSGHPGRVRRRRVSNQGEMTCSSDRESSSIRRCLRK